MNSGLYSGVQFTVHKNWFIISGRLIGAQTQGIRNAEDRKRCIEKV